MPSPIESMRIVAQRLQPLGVSFAEAIEDSRAVDLGGDCTARVISAPLFLATKLEAFKDRGNGDFYASHDLEDIVTIIDGRASIVEEVRSLPPALREFVSDQFTWFLDQPDFHDAFPGHLSGISGSRQRAAMVKARFGAIAALQNR